MPEINEASLTHETANLTGVPTAPPTNGPVVNPSGGLPDFGMGNLQEVLNFASRFEGHLKSIAETINGLATHVKQEKSGVSPAVAEDAAPTYVQNQVQIVEKPVSKEIDPLKVYQYLMHSLTQLPKDMTVETALENGRNMRDVIVAQIIQIIPELYVD